MKRDQFLARVREAARSGSVHRVHVPEPPAGVGYVGAGNDPLDRLAAEIIIVGGHAYRAPDAAAAVRIVQQIIAQYAPHRALCWEHSLLDRLKLAELLASQGVELISYRTLCDLSPEEQRKVALAADIGISSVMFAVAETGSLVLASGPGTERMTSLLPPVHIAVVEPSQVLADLFDVFDRLQKDGLDRLASNLVFITGPSKTGDIELTLTTGVHGPGELHVVIIGSPGE